MAIPYCENCDEEKGEIADELVLRIKTKLICTKCGSEIDYKDYHGELFPT